MSTRIALRHANGDIREVDIVRAGVVLFRENGQAIRRPYLEVNWPLCGHYILDLDRNVLLRATMWAAQDLDQAWEAFSAITESNVKRLVVPLSLTPAKEG